MPGGVKGKERAGRNQRNHHQHKLLKSTPTLTHTEIHRRPGNQIRSPHPSSGDLGPTPLHLGSQPGGTRDREKRVLSQPRPGLAPLGAYRVEVHDSPGTGGADGETGLGWTGRIHAAAAVPGVAWDSLLSSGGAAAVGGSSARGGPTSPRAAAPSTATPQDPGRRHLNQDGSRAGTQGARNPSETGSGRRAAAGPRDLCCPAAARRPHDGSGAPVGDLRASRFSGPSGHFAPEPLRLWWVPGLGAHVESQLKDPRPGWPQLSG